MEIYEVYLHSQNHVSNAPMQIEYSNNILTVFRTDILYTFNII